MLQCNRIKERIVVSIDHYRLEASYTENKINRNCTICRCFSVSIEQVSSMPRGSPICKVYEINVILEILEHEMLTKYYVKKVLSLNATRICHHNCAVALFVYLTAGQPCVANCFEYNRCHLVTWGKKTLLVLYVSCQCYCAIRLVITTLLCYIEMRSCPVNSQAALKKIF